MTTYQCLIVDDEPIAHRVLLHYLNGHDRVEVAHQAFHTHDARNWCQNHPVDLLFLDIQMPEETGLDFLRTLPQRPVTIFTTAFLDYALEGFELGVLDYLVKPIRKERFLLALNRAVEFLDLQQLQSTLLQTQQASTTISIQSGLKNVTLPIAALSHVQGLKDYAILFTPQKRYVVRMTMKTIETILAPHGFVRVHKSFIVSQDKAKLLHKNKIEFDEIQIPVGRKYRAAVRAKA